MKRVLSWCVVAMLALLATGATARSDSRPQRIAHAITELDVKRARELLAAVDSDSTVLTFERARLSIYLGDCDAAMAILSAPSMQSTPEGRSLGELAKTCAQATAAAVVVHDEKRGVWLRLQDSRDRALAPYITEVAFEARAAIEKDLGVDLPRPLRIDLVRDLYSLSAVSGLPVSAAETTGTVAVARWGRVTMLSPQASTHGYPWEDTLAHEITHLALSRATRDRAPLWLQEGIAKREETRWREQRPFDDVPSHDAVARVALRSGTSVGVDKLGPSIAMLPTPEAASIAFAEVVSFMRYWIAQNGAPALQLLLLDLKGVGGDDPNAAMRSVTGYPLSVWIQRWQEHLLEAEPEQNPGQLGVPHGAEGGLAAQPETKAEDVVRRLRLADLLMAGGHAHPAASTLEPVVGTSRAPGAIRWRATRSLLLANQPEAAEKSLGQLEDLDGIHGGWMALSGRFALERAERAAAAKAFRLGISVNPWLEDVACEGRARLPGQAAPLPEGKKARALCEAARELPGSELRSSL